MTLETTCVKSEFQDLQRILLLRNRDEFQLFHFICIIEEITLQGEVDDRKNIITNNILKNLLKKNYHKNLFI